MKLKTSFNSLESRIGVNYQLSNLWDFRIIDVSTGIYRYNPTTPLQFKLKSVALPFSKLDTINIKGTNQRFFNGHSVENMLSLEFYEDETFETYNYFNHWYNVIYNTEKQAYNSFPNPLIYQSACNREFQIAFNGRKLVSQPGLYGPEASSIFVNNFSFYIKEVKFLSIGDVSLSYEQGSPLTYTVNFTFNYLDNLNFQSSIPV